MSLIRLMNDPKVNNAKCLPVYGKCTGWESADWYS